MGYFVHTYVHTRIHSAASLLTSLSAALSADLVAISFHSRVLRLCNLACAVLLLFEKLGSPCLFHMCAIFTEETKGVSRSLNRLKDFLFRPLGALTV